MTERALVNVDSVRIGKRKKPAELMAFIEWAKTEFPGVDSELFIIDTFYGDIEPQMYLMVNRYETDEEMQKRIEFDANWKAEQRKKIEGVERKELARLLKKYPNGPDA